MRRLLLGLILLTPCFVVVQPCFGVVQKDTVDLARHLEQFRGREFYEMTAGEYKSVQNEYLAWVDSRVRANYILAEMNDELKNAGLLVADSIDAGYLDQIESEPVGDDLLALRLGVLLGGNCYTDETVVLYQRSPLQRIAQINAEQSYTHGYYLHALAVGRADGTNGRIAGSEWVASNCTSNWNTNIFRIDRVFPERVQIVLEQEAPDFGVFLDEEVKVSIERDTVRFDYTAALHHTDFELHPAVMRYQVQSREAVRVAPIATSLGGFIDEWLGMDDAEAARWSAPEAAAKRHTLTAESEKGLFEWDKLALCTGPGPALEVGVRWDKSGQLTVFHLAGGQSVADLRMLSADDRYSQACKEVDIDDVQSALMRALP